MKSWLILSSLLFLFSCGKEQFGTVAQSESDTLKGREHYSASFETKSTLLKPKVDILYVVDNSTSTHHIQEASKLSVAKTLEKISKEFDYRVISTPLISTSFTDYNVYTNSTDSLPNTSLIVPANSLLTPIFNNLQDGKEAGLARTINFMTYHEGTGLLRKGAYHLIILISNGLDEEVEKVTLLNGESELATVMENGTPVTLFSKRLASFNQLKTTLQSQQLRFFSVTASRACQSYWRGSKKSYHDMSEALYTLSGASDSSTKDVYDLCGDGFKNLFSGVNNSIKQQLVPHEYRYFPVTFVENNQQVDVNAIKVTKISGNTLTELNEGTDWKLESFEIDTTKPTREQPTLGEYSTGKYFIKLTNLLSYPDNIRITSTSLIEYFQYLVLPKPAKNDGTIVVRVNGQDIPKSAIVYEGFKANSNIKVSHQGSSATPGVFKTGYFIKITNPSYYYKSGDTVDIFFNPAPLE